MEGPPHCLLLPLCHPPHLLPGQNLPACTPLSRSCCGDRPDHCPLPGGGVCPPLCPPPLLGPGLPFCTQPCLPTELLGAPGPGTGHVAPGTCKHAVTRLRGSSVTRFLGHRHQRPACRPRKPNPSLQAPSSIAAPPPQGHMRPPSVPQLWHRPCDSRYLSGWPSRTEGCSPAMRGPQHHTQDRHLSLRELAGGSLAFWGPGAFLLRVGPSPSLVDVLGPREKLLGPPVVTLAIG